MIVLAASESAQTFKFIPRELEATHIILRDEQDNTNEQFDCDFTIVDYYLQAEDTFNLKEGRFYNLTVYNDTAIVYKDKIFCTSQSDYSINNGQYSQHETNNEYITL